MTAVEGDGDGMTGPVAPETNPRNKAVRPPVPDTTPPAAPAAPVAVAAPAKRRRLAGMPSGFTSLRDLLSFVSGVGIIAHEVWWSNGAPQVAILTVGVALAGLPVVFGADERKKPPST